jgi:hypothetical protein
MCDDNKTEVKQLRDQLAIAQARIATQAKAVQALYADPHFQEWAKGWASVNPVSEKIQTVKALVEE